ncbi:MAG: hypothetical protein AB1510_08940 [Bacillota bacterium]
MNKKYLLTGLLVVAFAAVGIFFRGGQPPSTAEGSTSIPLKVSIKTDKKYYLMDPYYWVYSASGSGVWPAAGYPRTVNFSVYLNNLDGSPAEVEGLTYQVSFAGGQLLTTGSAVYADPGVYSGSFVLSESNLGGQTFRGWRPKELTIKALVSDRVVKRQKIYVGRWGCDRCHLENNLARSIYPWCTPTGGALGPHYWGNILGRNDPSGGTDPESAEGFDLSYLTDPEKTHTPHDYLTSPPDLAHELPGYHERTNVKWSGSQDCSPCHQGSGRVRYPWGGTGEYPWLAHNRSLTVKCTFCHGIEGGYLPSGVLDWSDNQAENWQKGSKWVNNAGFSAIHGDCTNAHCHGHINDNTESEIDHAKPVCRDCHSVP